MGVRLARGVALVGAIAILATGCKRRVPNDMPLRVAAASDLSEAFVEIGAAFEKANDRKVTFAFAATGLLAKQIEEGAPYDVFAAANLSFLDDVIQSGACDAATKQIYAQGRIVVWSRGDAAFLPSTLEDLRRIEIKRLAIANPEHAPYGKAAKEALVKAGLWGAVQGKLVYGENVQQTLQFAQSGNADAAIVALSLATVSGGHWLPIEPALHSPLMQGMVVCRGAPNSHMQPDARTFESFVASAAGSAIMRRYGFVRPGEDSAAGR